MSKRLTGKSALVTGASKGIGAAIAKQLAAEGASVAVNYSSSKAGADKIVAEITAKGGKAVALQADLSKPDDAKRLMDGVEKAFGSLDILVNNAGVYEFAPLEAITPEHYRKIFDINVLGLLMTTQAAAKIMKDGGNIINISSAVSTLAPANTAVYSATKGAVDTITLVLAQELGPRKIRVNAINPGMILTEGVEAAGFTDMQAHVEATTYLNRLGKPEEIATTAAYLASDDASYVTGSIVRVSGGLR